MVVSCFIVSGRSVGCCLRRSRQTVGKARRRGKVRKVCRAASLGTGKSGVGRGRRASR